MQYPILGVVILIGAIIAFESPMLMYALLVFAHFAGLTTYGLATPLQAEVGIGGALFMGWFFKERLTPKPEAVVIKFPEAKIALLYLLWVTMGYAIWCYDRQQYGWLQFKYVIAGIVFFIIAPYIISNAKKLDIALLAWIGMGIFASLATFLFPGLSEPAEDVARGSWGEASSTFQSHKNWISSLIALSFFIILARIYWTRHFIIKAFLFLSLLLVLATIFYQQSRGTMVGVVGAAVIFWLLDTFFSSKRKNPLRLVARIFLLASIVAFILVTVFIMGLAELYGMYYELLENPMEVSTMETREQIWAMSADMIQGENHLIRGLGPGAFWALGPEYGITTFVSHDPEDIMRIHPHSLYLDVYLHLGIPGLICFMWLGIAVMVKLWKGFRTFRSKKYSYLCLGIFASLLSFYIHGIIEFRYDNIGAYWAFLGFAFAAYHVGLRYDKDY
jgi:O-antigen ligase